MNIKAKLEARKKFLEQKRDALIKKSQESQDINELRSINDQLIDIANELHDTADMISSLADNSGERESEGEQEDSGNQAQADENRSFNPVATYSVPKVVRSNEDMYGTLEYRTCFKNYVQHGVAIPAQYKRDADGIGPVNTTDLGAIIPTTIINEFIKKVQKVYGQIYAKVRKLNVRGGVKFPISDLKASFKWINETTVSPRQDAGEIKEFIEFSYNIGEIRVSQTLLSSIVALDLFESEVVKVMVEAYVEAMDKAIFRGSGKGSMLGFLNDPRVLAQTDHVVEMTASEFSDWKNWRKKLFAKLPLGKRSGEFIFPVSTVESYLLTMSDNNNNPIFREATGLEINDLDTTTSGRFFGREVTLVEPDVIQDFDTAEAGEVVGVFWTPSDYAINTNMAFGMKRYFDEEKNEWVNKALTIVDGKMLDVSGLWLIKKKASGN